MHMCAVFQIIIISLHKVKNYVHYLSRLYKNVIRSRSNCFIRFGKLFVGNSFVISLLL